MYGCTSTAGSKIHITTDIYQGPCHSWQTCGDFYSMIKLDCNRPISLHILWHTTNEPDKQGYHEIREPPTRNYILLHAIGLLRFESGRICLVRPVHDVGEVDLGKVIAGEGQGFGLVFLSELCYVGNGDEYRYRSRKYIPLGSLVEIYGVAKNNNKN